jgi:chromosome segregation ATPase
MKTEIESRLSKELNELNRNFKEDLSAKDKELLKCQKINTDLDSDINDKMNTIKEMKSSIERKDNEIESLISNIQLLSKDLTTANTSKRLLEEESARIRADMTERMHKLRTNMHSLLNREESESKIIESQITQLSAELEATKHRYYYYHL